MRAPRVSARVCSAAVRRTGVSNSGWMSTAVFFAIFSFLLYWPFVASFKLLPTPTGDAPTTANAAFYIIGSYFLALSLFLLPNLILAWTDEGLRTVERP